MSVYVTEIRCSVPHAVIQILLNMITLKSNIAAPVPMKLLNQMQLQWLRKLRTAPEVRSPLLNAAHHPAHMVDVTVGAMYSSYAFDACILSTNDAWLIIRIRYSCMECRQMPSLITELMSAVTKLSKSVVNLDKVYSDLSLYMKCTQTKFHYINLTMEWCTLCTSHRVGPPIPKQGGSLSGGPLLGAGSRHLNVWDAFLRGSIRWVNLTGCWLVI